MQLFINDKPVTAKAGQTLLELARKSGERIPTLCHHESLEARGSCRLCLVEISNPKWPGWKRLVASCVYPAQDGLNVKTSTPEIEKIRKTLIDLLLARCPDTEEVRELGREHGLSKSSFTAREKDDHCVLCGLCVRVCEDVIGACAIGISGRGATKVVGPAYGKSADGCIGCGACVHVCPTSCIAMDDEGMKRSIPRWNVTLDLVPCRKCGAPLSTRAHIDFVKKRVAVGPEVLETCADCLREYYAEKVATEGHM